jgi:O-antigen ligase
LGLGSGGRDGIGAAVVDPPLAFCASFTRTQLWTSTINLLRERPLTGAGLDQFLYLYRSRYILPEAWQEPNLSHPHNLLLDYWTRLGLVGLPVLAALQFGFWRTGLWAWRWLRRASHMDRLVLAAVVGALGSMANFLGHGLVDNSYFVVDLAYVFCFTLGIVAHVGGMIYSSSIADTDHLADIAK